jgi:hypothetical protein
MVRTLKALTQPRDDAEAVKLWLADRGLVAVHRETMNIIAHYDLCNGKPFELVYHQDLDRYYSNSRAKRDVVSCPDTNTTGVEFHASNDDVSRAGPA